MNQECLQIFKRIAAKQNGSDSDLYLKVLSKIIKFKEPYRSMSFLNFANIEDERIAPELLDKSRDDKLSNGEDNYKDLRLMNIRFQNIRQFPSALYGLSFERNGNPCSTFLVGRNSTGKSTIFSAIEYFYAKKVSNADLKSINNYVEYLKNCFVSKNDVSLSVKTKVDSHRIDYLLKEKEETKTYSKGIEGICMPAMFCSDYDIYTIGKIGNGDLTSFIFEQLGYTDLDEIRKVIPSIMKDISNLVQQAGGKQILLEKEDLEDILKVYMISYYSNKEDIIDLCEKYTTVENGIAVAIRHDIKDPGFLEKYIYNNCLFKEDWKQLQTILRSHLEGADAEIKKLGEKLTQKYDYLETLIQLEPVRAINLYEEWRKSIFDWSKGQGPDNKIRDPNKLLLVLTQVVYNLNLEINEILTNFIQDYSGFIEDSLKFFSEEYETFKFGGKSGDPRMLIHVAKEEGEQTTTRPLSPGYYLNSFRFKLYAITLKLSLAFYYMKSNRCILPIAIDDVFNANDFDNSIHLQYFVHKIYELYHDKVSKTIPLQLIMFTHDEIILSAFQKGYNTREIIKWNEGLEENINSQQKYNLYKDNCIIGRLHPYKEAEYIQQNISKKNLDSKSNNEIDFYNLFTEINYYGKK